MSIELSHRPAVVSRAPLQPREPVQYLKVTDAGPADWTQDPAAATAFASMREAARAALRLPAGLRAYSLPMPFESMVRETLH